MEFCFPSSGRVRFGLPLTWGRCKSPFSMAERGGGPTGHHHHRGLGGGLLSVCLSLYTICGLSRTTYIFKRKAGNVHFKQFQTGLVDDLRS